MQLHVALNERLRKIVFFFPFQLLLISIKRNHLLLIFWLIFFGWTGEFIAVKYGIPYLFLFPEYLGNVNFLSHLIVGFSCGGFVMAFHIASYILNGYKFPFIATLSRPFIKFCINNSTLPLVFFAFYTYQLIHFQYTIEGLTILQVIINALGLLSGSIIFILLSVTYFLTTNTNIERLIHKNKKEVKHDVSAKAHPYSFTPVKDVFHKKDKWYSKKAPKEWHTESYLAGVFKISLARGSEHYDKELLDKVFSQNHVNASLFELITIVSILVLGTFRENPVFLIPAGASIFLFFTISVMLTSALYSWFKTWSNLVIIVLLIGLNFISGKQFFNIQNHAYGLDYSTSVKYDNEAISKQESDTLQRSIDVAASLETLNKWRLNNIKNSLDRKKKPKMVFINSSGGGLRSAMWTFLVMQYIDSITKGQFMPHTQMITGSSGGMIGAAYYRELYLRKLQGENINLNDAVFKDNLTQDILNPLAFTIAVNDLFLRLQKFEYNGHSYTKDRGYAFEKQLNENLNGVLDKPLIAYHQAEKHAIIPTMLLTPVITNDGRRLIISAQNISYLVNSDPLPGTQYSPLCENIDFLRFFETQDAENLRFTTALRMSATFPYIMPNVTLPTDPAIEVIDAGARDNLGVSPTMKYIYNFRNWLSTNTSGIIIIQLRDKGKEIDIKQDPSRSILESLGSPLGAIYSNIFNIQNYEIDQMMQYASLWYDGPLDVFEIQLRHKKEDKISLSWHLTSKEKEKIQQALKSAENQEAVKQIKAMLE